MNTSISCGVVLTCSRNCSHPSLSKESSLSTGFPNSCISTRFKLQKRNALPYRLNKFVINVQNVHQSVEIMFLYMYIIIRENIYQKNTNYFQIYGLYRKVEILLTGWCAHHCENATHKQSDFVTIILNKNQT